MRAGDVQSWHPHEVELESATAHAVAEPLRFAGARASTDAPEMLREWHEAAQALRGAATDLRQLEREHARIASRAPAGASPAAPAVHAAGADLAVPTQVELAVRLAELKGKRKQTDEQAAELLGKLDSLRQDVESIENRNRENQLKLTQRSDEHRRLLADAPAAVDVENVSAFEDRLKAAQQHVQHLDQQLGKENEALRLARDASAAAQRRQTIRDGVLPVMMADHTIEAARNWVHALVGEPVQAHQGGRRATLAQRIKTDFDRLFATSNTGEVRPRAQDPAAALERLFKLCATLLPEEEYGKLEGIQARLAATEAGMDQREAVQGRLQVPGDSLAARVVRWLGMEPHAMAATLIVAKVAEGSDKQAKAHVDAQNAAPTDAAAAPARRAARPARSGPPDTEVIATGAKLLHKALAKNRGWLAGVLLANAQSFSAMLKVDGVERAALWADEYVSLIEPRIAATEERQVEARDALGAARTEFSAAADARAARLASASAERTPRIEAAERAVARVRAQLQEDGRAQQSTVARYMKLTGQYADKLSRRDQLDAEIEVVAGQRAAMHDAWHEAKQEHAQERQRQFGELAAAHAALDDAWEAVQSQQAIARAITPEALDRAIGRHLQQSTDQMIEHLVQRAKLQNSERPAPGGMLQVEITATYKHRSDMLQALADAIDDASRRNPQLLAASTPAEVEGLGYRNARFEWLCQHAGVVGHGVRRSGGHVDHPNAVTSSYTLDWAEAGNSGAVRITHLYPWLPRR
ncbi:hypothetical protein FSO04_37285 [Paraburkholderia madseniana]|uniref:Uncharacterized protein n=1 Tax=Paraburkholderia madseniana TaxID=2599607 RepID=A0A6N6W3U2_9BURK|nr:hypothetical protein [Paraburkholderia madseniana]KAE8754881.1 hypothetical protein FSO04_37285 [Paraburkholderia madseniana]